MSDVPGFDDDGVAELEWKIHYTTAAGDSVTLTRADAETLLHTLLCHRLLVVDVEFPEHCTEPLAAASFGTGNAVAMTYDDADQITLDLSAQDLISTYPLAAAKAAAKRKKRGGSK